MGEGFRRTFDEARYQARYPDVRRLIEQGLVKDGLEHWTTTDGPYRSFWWSPVRNRPIRAVFVTPSLDMGGAECWIELLIRLFDPGVVTCRAVLMTGEVIHEELARKLAPRVKIHVTRQDGAKGDYSKVVMHETLPLACTTAFADADVMIVWGLADISIVADHFPGRVVFVSHGTAPHALQSLSAAVPYASHLAAVSATAAGDLIKHPRMTVIHNGIDLDRCTPTKSRAETRKGWGLVPDTSGPHLDKKLIGYVGRLSPEKDPLAVARAVSALPENYHAVFAGAGPHADKYRQLAEHIAPGRCTFLGHVSDTGNVYAAIDALVLASHTEAHSLTLCEAWAAGVPAVATEVGAVAEIEEAHGSMTVRVPRDPTTQELAVAVRAAASRGRTTEIQAIARRSFSGQYMARKWESYLVQVCASQGPIVLNVEPPDLPELPIVVDKVPEVLPTIPEFIFYEHEYLTRYPEAKDGVDAGVFDNGLDHWNRAGKAMGYDPCWRKMTDFDGRAYLDKYPKLKALYATGGMVSPMMHFIRFGNAENLQATFKK